MATMNPYFVSSGLVKTKMLIFATSQAEAKEVFCLKTNAMKAFVKAELKEDAQKFYKLSNRDCLTFIEESEVYSMIEVLEKKTNFVSDQIAVNEQLNNLLNDTKHELANALEHIDKDLTPALEDCKKAVKEAEKYAKKMKQFSEDLEKSNAELTEQLQNKTRIIVELNEHIAQLEAEISALNIATVKTEKIVESMPKKHKKGSK